MIRDVSTVILSTACLFTELDISGFSNRLRYHVSFQVCQHLDSLKARLSQDLVFVVWSFVESWSLSGHPRPSLFGHPCTVGVLAGTHQCATLSRVTLWQSANPCMCWLESWRLAYAHVCSTGSAVQALCRHHSQTFVSFAPTFLRVLGALSNSSSCSTRSSSRSRSRRNFLACCRRCRNPSCSRKCKAFFSL